MVGGALECLPKEVEPRAILPLGLLHTDLVCWHLVSSYSEVGGAHQSDRNPTLDISTCLRVGLFPLGVQATGKPSQGIHRLHIQQLVHRGNKCLEVPMLLEASLQINLLFPLFLLMEALLWVLRPVCQGVSFYDTDVMNTVCPLLPEVPDKKVFFLLCDLWRLHICVLAAYACPGWCILCPLHGAT